MAEKRRGGDIAFLTILRAAAALLVVWDHLVGSWLDGRRATWLPNTWLERFVAGPLGIIQHFGFFAVALFFLISGFIITHVAQREARVPFLVKRLLRIYPPLVVSVVVIFLLDLLYARLAGHPFGVSDRSRWDVLWATTLLNYLRMRQQPVSGVAWTLAIEMLFYTACFLLLPLVQKRPRLAMGIAIAAVFLIDRTARDHGVSYFLFAVLCSYLPFLLAGQIIYYVWSGRIRWWEGLAFFVANYLVLLIGLRDVLKMFYTPGNSYGISFMYALAAFVCLLLVNGRLRVPRVVAVCADMSYSIYLYHGQIGIPVLSALAALLPYSAALPVALVAAGATAYLSWRFVERPSQRAARWLIARRPRRDRPDPAPAVAAQT